MDLDALAPVAPVSDGLARRPADALERLERPEARPLTPHNPSEVLAMLMDFSGSVALAEQVHAPVSTKPSHPEARRLARELHEQIRAQLDMLEPVVLRPLNGPRAPTPPAPAKILEAIALVTGGPGIVPEGQAIARLARELGGPLRSALATCLRQARVQVAGLRAAISTQLQTLGPRADRLERIDAALQRSIDAKLGELFERMEHTAALSFERACAQACAALPPEFGAGDLAGWAADGGFIDRHRSRCEHMTLALFGHLRRSLEGLVLAVAAEAA